MRFIGIGLMLCALIAPVAMANAQDRAIHWERYDIAVAVGSDGKLSVVETQHLVIDQGSFRTGSRSFATGAFGRVRSVSVSEDGQLYTRGTEQPGTFSASDDGERFQLGYVFRDEAAPEHTMTISYTVAQSLSTIGGDALLEWNFFCADSCPRIDSGSLTFQPPPGIPATNLEPTIVGAAVTATQTGNQWRWTLDEPVQGEQVTLSAHFPRSALAPSAIFRSDGNALQPARPNLEPSISEQPSSGIPSQPVRVGSISPIFCVVGVFILIAVFSMMGRSARPRRVMGGTGLPGLPMPGLGMGGFGMPQRRRRFGRGFGHGYGGWGVPPIIPPRPPSYGDQNPWGGSPGPGRSTDGDTSGGGGFSWDDSGGGGSSWNNSGGDSSSWGDSGGGGSDNGAGGGGRNDSSNFN